MLSPDTVIGEEEEAAVAPPGLEVAVNVAVPVFPLYAERKVTVAAALPAVADTDVGVSGFLPPASLTPIIGIRRSNLLQVQMNLLLHR